MLCLFIIYAEADDCQFYFQNYKEIQPAVKLLLFVGNQRFLSRLLETMNTKARSEAAISMNHNPKLFSSPVFTAEVPVVDPLVPPDVPFDGVLSYLRRRLPPLQAVR